MADISTRVVSIEEAQLALAHLIDQVLAGDEVLIAAADGRTVRMERIVVPRALASGKPLLGAMRGRINVGDEALEPLPDEWLGLDIWDDKPR